MPGLRPTVNQVDILMETNALTREIYQTFEKYNTIELGGQIELWKKLIK